MPPRRYRLAPFALLRLLLVASLCAVLATSLLVAAGVLPVDRRAERTSTLAGLVLFTPALAFAARRWRRRSPRTAAITELLLCNLAATMIAVEVAMIVYAHAFPSPLVWDESSVRAGLDANRQPPGNLYFGFRCNAQGYHDDAFFVSGERDFVVAVLADSFGLGVVPYAYNFVTVAERRLQQQFAGRFDRVACHNFGVPGIGPAQYLWQLDHEVPQYHPAVVLMCLFVGNDVLHNGMRLESSRFYSLQRWLTPRVVARLIGYGRQRDTAARLSRIGAAPDDGSVEAVAPPAWLHDPSLEPPSMTAADFDRIATERFEVLDAASARTATGLENVCDALDYAVARVGERLRVVLIPDEFQVDDALFARLLAARADPTTIERDLPQRRVVAHCQARGIPVLDLLPVLRAHVRAGGARVYHLRDTHWNAGGNRLAGEAIGDWLGSGPVLPPPRAR